jgi:hypothetical protein
MDRHQLSLALKGGAVALALALAYHYWFSGSAGIAGSNLFVNASLIMCFGLVLLSDPLIENDGVRVLAKFTGYAGLIGHGLARFVFA